jgi:hypothetical protein
VRAAVPARWPRPGRAPREDVWAIRLSAALRQAAALGEGVAALGEGVTLREGAVGLPSGTAALSERHSALRQAALGEAAALRCRVAALRQAALGEVAALRYGVAALRQAALGEVAALWERLAARGGGAGTVGPVVLGELRCTARQGVARLRHLPVVLRLLGAALGKRLASVRKRVVTVEQRVAKAGQHIALRYPWLAAPGVERLERRPPLGRLVAMRRRIRTFEQ